MKESDVLPCGRHCRYARPRDIVDVARHARCGDMDQSRDTILAQTCIQDIRHLAQEQMNAATGLMIEKVLQDYNRRELELPDDVDKSQSCRGVDTPRGIRQTVVVRGCMRRGS